MGNRVKTIIALVIIGFVAALVYAGRRSLIGFGRQMMQSPLLLILLLVVLVAIVLVVLFIVHLLRSTPKAPAAQVSSPEQPQPSPEPASEATLQAPAKPRSFSRFKMRRSFSTAMSVLRRNMPGRDYKYTVPWFLLIGQDTTAKTEALRKSGLNLPLGQPLADTFDGDRACHWWFFERGVILDVAGDLVLGPDDRTANRRAWRYLLRLLQKYRPRRPLDGILLALPGKDLVMADPNQEAGLQLISTKADSLYDRIGEAQKTLAMRLPLFVLVTGCEAVQGFKSFCREIPQRLGRNIFGWSNPYALDKSYSGQWVNEAFQSMNRDLTEIKFEALARGSDSRENDGLFLFPNNFDSLSIPLKTYLDHICKASIYQAPFMLRGIYFCGDSGIDKVRNVAPQTFFLQDLLSQKVFAEAGLARPLPKAQLLRNRGVLATQICAALIVLIGGIGLWQAHRHFQTEKAQLHPVLEEIAHDIRAMQNEKWSNYDGLELYRYLDQRPAANDFEDAALNLFAGMTRGLSIHSVFVPSSWFSSLHKNIIKAIALAYDEIIYKTMYVELYRKAKTIFESRHSSALIALDSGMTVPLAELPEFVELRNFVNDLIQLEEHGELFNRLPESNRAEDFSRLEQYLFGVSILPEDYEKRMGDKRYLFQQWGLMTKPRVFDPTLFTQQSQYFMVLVERLYARLFKYNPICIQLQRLGHKLEQFQMMTPGDATSKVLLKDLDASIRATEAMVADPIFAWMAKDSFAPGQEFSGLMEVAPKARFIGPALCQQARESGEAAFRQLKAELRQKQTHMTGPLLARTGGAIQLRLSSGVMGLKAAVQKLLGYDFTEIQPAISRAIEIPPGMRLMWDEKLLAEAVSLIQPYADFINGGIENFPPEMHQIIAGLAKNSLESNLFETVSKAQHLEPLTDRFFSDSLELAVRSEIKNFTRAVPLLNRLIRAAEQFDLAQAHMVLAKLLAWQASTLLEAVDGFLDEADLYGVRGQNFAWWDGRTPLALAAYDAVDERELKNHLSLQQERIRYLAYQYAEPIVTFLITSGVPRNIRVEKRFIRWKRILEELEKFEQKKPGNSLTVLENFILHEMNQINSENYFKLIDTKELTARSGDYFLSRKYELQRQIYDRGRELALTQKVNTCNELARYFNQHLAGKYPFTETYTRTEADPGALRQFFTRFDTQAPAISAILEADPLFGSQKQPVQRFIAQMTAVRQLFGAFLDAAPEKGDAKPALNFKVAFRINRAHEKLANRILSWQLAVGANHIIYTDKNKAGVWHYGDPVAIILRWAKDGVDYPVAGDDRPGVVVKDQTVRFSFDNQWSLIRMLQERAGQPQDFTTDQDPSPYTLRFEVDTRRRKPESESEAQTRARVYIRVQLVRPAEEGQPEEIIRLPYFPWKAPKLAIKEANKGDPNG